jgi:hypothetical protein
VPFWPDADDAHIMSRVLNVPWYISLDQAVSDLHSLRRSFLR